ncbi:MAG: tetratricopeptide repeat protein [Pseudomonadota bacterium]
MKELVKRVLRRGAVAIATAFAISACHRAKSAQKPIECESLVRALTAAKQPGTAINTVRSSARAADGCRYAEVAGRAALDADLPPFAQRVLGASPTKCARAQLLLGERAEALARAGKSDEAEAAAKLALKTNPTNPYAELALSRVAYDRNQMTVCAEHGEAALKFGRGAEAERLLGRSLLARGQFEAAEAHFKKVLEANPNDAEAAFSAAVCDDRLGHYYLAREGFLQTLRIDPKHQQARFYLAVLTHQAGFDAEAQHHLAKFAEVVPKDDPQRLQLEQLLNGADGGAPDAGLRPHGADSAPGKR